MKLGMILYKPIRGDGYEIYGQQMSSGIMRLSGQRIILYWSVSLKLLKTGNVFGRKILLEV